MQKQISLRLLPHQAANDETIISYIASSSGNKEKNITGFHRIKESLDARSKQVYINLTVNAFINEPFTPFSFNRINFNDVSAAKHTVIIIGAGPAGLFAALKLIELGIKPIILERGKDVRARRRDLAILNKEGIINPESNYCFGEGGAGTYSDGKLYTRSNKRGDINRLLNLFVQFGADEKILYVSHPHIGTNKLPQIITGMRQQIIDCGGEILFEEKLVDIIVTKNKIEKIITSKGNKFSAEAVLLATGHSARDIFILLNDKNILIEAKPFALGVRIEHPQQLIDQCQYKVSPDASGLKGEIQKNTFLPPASYSLVEQVNGRGVFSFCMCPGGIIATASTNENELVVNGWSPSKRNNPFANSGMVVPVEIKDAVDFFKKEPTSKNKKTILRPETLTLKPQTLNLTMMHFQQSVEQKAYTAGGGKFVAPAQRMVDFCNNKISSSLHESSYLPGLQPASLQDVLPPFIYQSLQKGFMAFGKKMKGYYTNEAIVVATESRTSSPVRIPRDGQTLQHPQIKNLYPCGEGAGYAGGIISAAMDGEKVAAAIHQQITAL